MFLDCGGKPEYPERIHTDPGRTCKGPQGILTGNLGDSRMTTVTSNHVKLTCFNRKKVGFLLPRVWTTQNSTQQGDHSFPPWVQVYIVIKSLVSWPVTYRIKSGPPWVSLEMKVSCVQSKLCMAILAIPAPAIINKRSAMDENSMKCQQMQLWFIPHYSAELFCDQQYLWSLVCFWKYKWWVSVFTFEQKDSGLLNKRSAVTQRADLVYNDGGRGVPRVQSNS